MKRYTVCLDVDGVLADCTQGILDALNARLGSAFTPNDITEYSITKSLQIPWGYVHHAMVQEGFVANLKPYEGVLDHVKRLREKYKVLFVTAPYPSSYHWGDERREWLLEHGFAESMDEIFLTPHKHEVQGDVLIDDKVDNVKSWCLIRQTHGVLWPAPYNHPLITFVSPLIHTMPRENPWGALFNKLDELLP